MKLRADADEDQDGDDLEQHHDVVGLGRLADAADQDHGEDHDDEEGGDVEAEVPAGRVEHVALQILRGRREDRRARSSAGGMDAEPVEQRDDVRGEADADGHVGEGVFEDQVPADDPGDQLAERGVGVGVGRAGDGDHRRQFGVAEAGEAADDGDENQRERERRSGAGPPGERGVVHEVVEQRGVEDGGGVELLAGDGGADDGEDARADDGADAERGKRHGPERLLQACLGILRLAISLSMDLQQRT